jgi:hypothetical protein
VNVLRRPISERAQDIGAWYGVLAVVSQLAVVTNALLIAITSNFVGFEVYRRGGYSDDYTGMVTDTLVGEVPIVPVNDSNSNQGLSGYANWSSTAFEVLDLVDGRAFPAYSAQSLEFLNADGSEVTVIFREEGDDTSPLYLPFINFTCLSDMKEKCSAQTTTVEVSLYYDDMTTTNTTFTEQQYERFYANESCSKLVFDAGRDDSPENGTDGPCFNGAAMCRFRGVVREERPIAYWNTWTARLAFIIVFEHFIFVVSAFLAWLIPDVPQSVKNEIQKEKLLAFEAIHARHDAGKELGVKDGGPSPPPGTNGN